MRAQADIAARVAALEARAHPQRWPKDRPLREWTDEQLHAFLKHGGDAAEILGHPLPDAVADATDADLRRIEQFYRAELAKFSTLEQT